MAHAIVLMLGSSVFVTDGAKDPKAFSATHPSEAASLIASALPRGRKILLLWQPAGLEHVEVTGLPHALRRTELLTALSQQGSQLEELSNDPLLAWSVLRPRRGRDGQDPTVIVRENGQAHLFDVVEQLRVDDRRVVSAVPLAACFLRSTGNIRLKSILAVLTKRTAFLVGISTAGRLSVDTYERDGTEAMLEQLGLSLQQHGVALRAGEPGSRTSLHFHLIDLTADVIARSVDWWSTLSGRNVVTVHHGLSELGRTALRIPRNSIERFWLGRHAPRDLSWIAQTIAAAAAMATIASFAAGHLRHEAGSAALQATTERVARLKAQNASVESLRSEIVTLQEHISVSTLQRAHRGHAEVLLALAQNLPPEYSLDSVGIDEDGALVLDGIHHGGGSADQTFPTIQKALEHIAGLRIDAKRSLMKPDGHFSVFGQITTTSIP